MLRRPSRVVHTDPSAALSDADLPDESPPGTRRRARALHRIAVATGPSEGIIVTGKKLEPSFACYLNSLSLSAHDGIIR
jgi:hypothetical protein